MNNSMIKLSYGLFVVTTTYGAIDNGCITNTVMQVTASPNRISCAINKANYTCALVQKSRKFNVSIISERADFALFKHFGFQTGKNVDKFENLPDYARTENGLPYITKGTNAYISANVLYEIDLGTHVLFIADVVDSADINDEKSATYAYYFEHIKPKPQEKASTKTVWQCKICGYEVEADTLPDGFTCPLCKHPKEDFMKL